jgi:ubiquinone/menaquinone biosynthesis C-methylase UbiE
MRPVHKLITRVLGLFFKILYTRLSWAYDAVAWLSSMGQWRTWQLVAVEQITPGDILEIGFGTGHIQEELIKRQSFCVGIDISTQMTRITQKRLHRADLPVNIAQASTYKIPFEESRFTTVLSTFPSEFLYNLKTYKEIHRVLKPGGQLIMIPGIQKITGPGSDGNVFLRVSDRFVAWLYSFTSEEITPEVGWKERFIDELDTIGFSTQIESVKLERAVVLRIVAHKKGAQS